MSEEKVLANAEDGENHENDAVSYTHLTLPTKLEV